MDYFEDEKFEGLRYISEIVRDREYVDCEFHNCNFVDVEINNCIFKECTFYNCKMNNVVFKFSTMKNATLLQSEFIGVNWNVLIGDSFSAGPINKVSECFFKYNNFISMKLNNFNFSGSRFQECLFEDSDLIDANFKGVRFDATQFTQCNLARADFRDAYGYIIDIQSNKLKKAKFSFPEVTNLLNSIDIVID